MPRIALVFGLAAALATLGCDEGAADDPGDDMDAGVDDGGADDGGADDGGGDDDGGVPGEACYVDDEEGGCDCGLAAPPDCPDTITAGEDFECDLVFTGGVESANVISFAPGDVGPTVSGTGFVEEIPANGQVTVTVESFPTAEGDQIIAVDWDDGSDTRFSTCGASDLTASVYDCFTINDGMQVRSVTSTCSLEVVNFQAP